MTRSPLLRQSFGICAFIAVLGLSNAQAEGLSSYGTPGLIDMPNAFTTPDGVLNITSTRLTDHTRNSLHFQITPRLSGVFRYSILRGYSTGEQNPDRFDRSFDLHYQIRAESPNLPAVAIGLRDFGGTGLFGAEYLTASKHIGERIAVTGGIGWGRLGSYGGFTNPLGGFDDRFNTRPGPSGEITETGRVSFNQFFRGDAAWFGGIEYQMSDRLRLVAEYSSDAYTLEVARMGFERKTPVNLGFNYRASESFTLNGFWLGGAKAGIGLTYAIDPRKPSVPGGNERKMPPIQPRSTIAQLGWDGEATATTRQRLAAGLVNQGLALESYQKSRTQAEVVLSNDLYSGSAQALGRAARVMANTLPSEVETFKITLAAQGMPLSQTTLRRSDLEELEHAWDGSWQSFVRADISDAPTRLPPDAGAYPNLDWSILPYYTLSLFDPDDPLRYDLGIAASGKYNIAPGTSLTAVVQQKVYGTLGDSSRPSNSLLPHVRSDQALYDKQTGPQVAILTADYLFRPGGDLFGRMSAGYFEQMYAGVSGEILWYPVESRLALGAELNYVAQREIGSTLGVNDYRVATGHASAYYDFGNTFYGQLDVGRYLAGDWGATVSLDRKFDNGVTVGAFFTLTDVPFKTFGEGSFDKGIRFTFPIDWLSGQPGRSGFTQTIRPVSRDGGARLSISNRLYEQVNEGNAIQMGHNWGKFWR